MLAVPVMSTLVPVIGTFVPVISTRCILSVLGGGRGRPEYTAAGGGGGVPRVAVPVATRPGPGAYSREGRGEAASPGEWLRVKGLGGVSSCV